MVADAHVREPDGGRKDAELDGPEGDGPPQSLRKPRLGHSLDQVLEPLRFPYGVRRKEEEEKDDSPETGRGKPVRLDSGGRPNGAHGSPGRKAGVGEKLTDTHTPQFSFSTSFWK